MTPAEEDWPALKWAVADALELPAEARRAHIEARCSDPSLREEALRLLRACEEAESSPLLDMPAAEFAAPLLTGLEEREDEAPEALRTALAGRYAIERELGRGGMATVYLAYDERHGRSVAIKLLRPGLLPGDGPGLGADWFQREIEIAARLSHPHILPLYDSGAVAGLLYYITPYVDGESLEERLRRDGRPPLPEALRLLRDVARALAYAHRQGLVHRDIKPANILLTQEGDALVADFGVAKGLIAARGRRGARDAPPAKASDGGTAEASDAAVTHGPGAQRAETREPEPGEGLVLGTPAYMAPEQVTGDPEIDARADLYAFGAVAYELLTGSPPFAGRTRHELAAAHLSETPRPVAAHRPDVPKALAGLVDRSLAKSPDDRPLDAAEVLGVLDAALTAASTEVPTGGTRGARRVIARSVRLVSVLAVLLLAWWLAFAREAPSPAERSIAVLPFGTGSGSLEEAAFAEGMTGEVIGALSRVPGVRVAARTSLAAIERGDLDALALADTLGVETVLQGSVHRDGDRLRVAATLVGARENRILWSRTYEPLATDVFAFQERFARDVAEALAPGGTASPLPDRLTERGTEDRAAYELYLRGRHLVSTRQREGLSRALELFDEAIARDSSYARAWAGQADAWTFLAIFGHVAPSEAFPNARVAAERAVALDSLLVEGHAALAHQLFVYEWSWEAAEAALQRAIALDPRYPLLRMYYASYLHSVGRSQEALAQLARARELDPLTPTGALSGRIYVDTGRPDEAIRVLEPEIEREPRLDLGHQLLAHAYLQKGMHAEAIASMRRAAALSGTRDMAQLAYVHASAGDPEEARLLLDEVLESGGRLELLGFHLAMAYAALGEPDEAFRWLGAARAERAGFMNLLAVTAGFESLRSDPRFDAILQRMGLRQDG